jgi:hypothetical protein
MQNWFAESTLNYNGIILRCWSWCIEKFSGETFVAVYHDFFNILDKVLIEVVSVIL